MKDQKEAQEKPSAQAQVSPVSPLHPQDLNKSEESVPLSAVEAIVAKAVAEALSKRIHQHTPIGQVLQHELSGRSRDEGTLVVSKLDETKGYVEYGFNDGTIRRDYK
jgi:hypothetical protein